MDKVAKIKFFPSKKALKRHRRIVDSESITLKPIKYKQRNNHSREELKKNKC